MKKVLLLFGVLGMISCSPDPDPDPDPDSTTSEESAVSEAEAETEAANSYYTISNDSKIVVKAGTTTIAAGECKKFKESLFPLTITKVDGSDYTSSFEKKQYEAGNYSLRQTDIADPRRSSIGSVSYRVVKEEGIPESPSSKECSE